MATLPRPPAIEFQGRRWPPEELVHLARAWREIIGADPPGASGLVATAMVNHPHAVALFFALSTLPLPLIVLPDDARAWHTEPGIPPGTPLYLAPGLRGLAPRGTSLRLRVTVLPDRPASPGPGQGPIPFLQCPGLVYFTSGSTGRPKPVYKQLPDLLLSVRARARAHALPPDSGVLGTLPLGRAFGMNSGLLLPTVLGATLGLVERFDPRLVLPLFASEAHRYWAASPVMADLLARSATRTPHPAPAVCDIGGRVSPALFDAFRRRFGVPLRSYYGTTELGGITADDTPAAEVRPGTVGRPMPGVELAIGDDPASPLPQGGAGRVWVRSLWGAHDYGFPPRLEPRPERDGFWPTSDLGRVDAAGRLVLIGRRDETIRTDAGFLVNVAEVATALAGLPGVIDAAAVPLEGPAGPVVGVLVETDGALSVAQLRTALARALPAWSQPRVLEVTRTLPRLADGRVDRRTCIATLQRLV